MGSWYRLTENKLCSDLLPRIGSRWMLLLNFLEFPLAKEMPYIVLQSTDPVSVMTVCPSALLPCPFCGHWAAGWEAHSCTHSVSQNRFLGGRPFPDERRTGLPQLPNEPLDWPSYLRHEVRDCAEEHRARWLLRAEVFLHVAGKRWINRSVLWALTVVKMLGYELRGDWKMISHDTQRT